MQRHIFGPLFEPQSLLIVSDQPLSLAHTLPSAEQARLTTPSDLGPHDRRGP